MAPILFVSHGSPMLAIDDSPAHGFLQTLGKELPRPSAILVVSAHWERAGEFGVTTGAHPETIHDFSGFPRELEDMVWPAPGALQLADQCLAALQRAGIQAVGDARRGFDHGVWVPLSIMFPAADVPVCQVSLLRGASMEAHCALGRALREAIPDDALVVCSGSMTHNLYEAMGKTEAAAEAGWSREFADWVGDALVDRRLNDLLDYRIRAPWGRRNHPSAEHIAPLFVALGIAGPEFSARPLFRGVVHGVIAMDSWVLQEKAA